MRSRFGNILFDLDGTLTDSQDGIFRCIHYAMRKIDLPLEDSVDLRWCVGPPLQTSLTQLANGDPRLGAKALEFYRERYRTTGIFENRLYEGIETSLLSLDKDFDLYLATSKPQVYAVEVLRVFKIEGLFKGVHGSELDCTRTDKHDLISHLLKVEKLDEKKTVMVGDREHDILGAVQNGLQAIGVSWGFGSQEELQRAGATTILQDPQDLPPYFHQWVDSHP